MSFRHRKHNSAAIRLASTLSLACVGLVLMGLCPPFAAPASISPLIHLLAEGAIDQDDMCIWVHPEDKAKSTVITADKQANKLFVYDLQGQLLQTISMPKPGNIDIRYGFQLAGERVDIVAYLQRLEGHRIVVFVVDPASRQLRRVDNDSILTGAGKGGALYHSRKTDRFYFFKTSQDEGHGGVEQYELSDDGGGRVTGKKVRQWDHAGIESAVADDEAARLYLADEDRGIWELGADPDDPVPGTLVIKTGEHGLVADVEGLTIYPAIDGGGYLIVSNQSRNEFKVYERRGGHRFIGTFTLEGVERPDGIDVINVDLGPEFSGGLFVTHSETPGSDQCPVMAASWESIARAVGLPASIGPPKHRPTGRGPSAGFGDSLQEYFPLAVARLETPSEFAADLPRVESAALARACCSEI